MEFVKNMSFAILAEAPSTVPIPRTDPVRQRGSGSEVPPPNRFEQEQMELNLRNARMGAWFVMILVPLCSFLDWMAYPERYWEFLVLRLACAASLHAAAAGSERVAGAESTAGRIRSSCRCCRRS
jgi:hypothetical protein